MVIKIDFKTLSGNKCTYLQEISIVYPEKALKHSGGKIPGVHSTFIPQNCHLGLEELLKTLLELL
ncbi:MAG: hypothetical protein AYK18_18010 [Theionarchaea archaeon DG-70]|nr:MAG: hypothetical protein AYK18_18010 [Theionarchaea archaeon DG-70]